MSRRTHEILFEFASNFATYHHEGEDAKDPYWWGHDTNLGTQTTAFAKAEKAIGKFKREQLPARLKGTAHANIPKAKREQIAIALFGKGKVPAYWHGSLGESEVLLTLARVKGAFKV